MAVISTMVQLFHQNCYTATWNFFAKTPLYIVNPLNWSERYYQNRFIQENKLKKTFFKFIVMKRYILAAIVMAMVCTVASAQKIRLNGYSAYVFNDNVDSRYDAGNYYEGTINGGYQWGVGLEFMADAYRGIELKYIRQDALAPMNYAIAGDVKRKEFELGINYILLGGSNYFPVSNPKISPYAGLGLGACIIDVKNPLPGGESSKTNFAWNIKLGTNIWLSDKVGLKLQTELLSAIQGAGGGLYFGTGGAGAGVSTYSTMYQFSLGGGLTFKMGK
jgi:hypothetical protein